MWKRRTKGDLGAYGRGFRQPGKVKSLDSRMSRELNEEVLWSNTDVIKFGGNASAH